MNALQPWQRLLVSLGGWGPVGRARLVVDPGAAGLREKLIKIGAKVVRHAKYATSVSSAMLLNVLERCLTSLVAKGMSVHRSDLRRADKAVVREIMSEVDGDAPYRPLLMSIELQHMLEGLEINHLLNVVAECFDLLVMVPLLQKQTAALSHDDWKRGAGR